MGFARMLRSKKCKEPEVCEISKAKSNASCFSIQTIEFRSMFCDTWTYELVSTKNLDEFRGKTTKTFMEIMKNAMRIKWLQEQSICYEQQTHLMLSPIVISEGVCFRFNMDENVLEKSM
jgi:hypothetical protein